MKEPRASGALPQVRIADHPDGRDAPAAALRAHDPFIGHLAHALRSALNGITGWTAVLEDRRMSGPVSPVAERAIAGIRKGVEQQVRLIDAVCDASELLAGRRRLYMAPMRMRPALELAVERMRSAMEEKELGFVVDLGLVDETIEGDHERVVQTFEELLRNAARCTAAGGRVRLTAGSFDDRVVVTIEDTGRGLPTDFESWLFDPRRASGCSGVIDGELGLGLPVCKLLVQLHGGSIEARSAGPARGTRVTVALPRCRSVPTAT